jgi:branched-chain amino acid transport system substrate-binding protein
MRPGMLAAAWVLAGAAALALAAGCAGGGNDTESTGAQGTGGVGELRIGVLVPLTGALKDFGGPGVRAATLARDQLNRAAGAAGIDLTVRTVEADTGTDPRGAQEAATKLVESDGVSCIAGPWASSEVIAVAENVTVDAGVPTVSPSSTASSVREVDDQGLLFRVPTPDHLQAPILARTVRDALGTGATVNVAGQNDAYGTGLVNGFTSEYTAIGGRIGRTTIFNEATVSLDSEAARIAGGRPAGWVIITFPETWAKLGPALLRTGRWDPTRTFGTDGLRSQDLPAKVGMAATEGIRGTAPTEKPNQAFDRLWRRSGLGKRQTFDAQNFDAVVLCALAALSAGSTDPGAIAERMRAVSGPPGPPRNFNQLRTAISDLAAGTDIDYQGASGPIDLAEDRDPGIGNYIRWSYSGGKLVDGTTVIRAGP